LCKTEMKLINRRLYEQVENEDVFRCLWWARWAIYRCVRRVKKETKSDFRGIYAEGDDLDLIVLRPQDVRKTGTVLTTWLFTASVGTDYYESDTGDADLVLGAGATAEGRVYCGWADPIDSPKIVAVLYELPKRNVLVPTPFELAKDYPVINHMPITIEPGQSYKIGCRYFAAGDDKARPIAVRITKAELLTL